MDQSRWMQLMPSPIAMDAIDAIIARRQNAREASPSNATSKALQGGLTDKRDKGVVSVIGHGILAGKYLAEYRDSLK